MIVNPFVIAQNAAVIVFMFLETPIRRKIESLWGAVANEDIHSIMD